MKNAQIPKWARNAGAMTALGSVGASLAYWALGTSPQLSASGLTSEQIAVIIGGAGGVAVLRYLFDFVQLGEVAILRRAGIIPESRAKQWRLAILARHFPAAAIVDGGEPSRQPTGEKHPAGTENAAGAKGHVTVPRTRT
jgi:hypothetical protein